MQTLKNVLKDTCIYTVIITLIFAIVGLFTLDKEASIPLTQFLLIILFGLFIATGKLVLHCDKWKSSIRYLVHFLMLYISFICTFYLTGKVTTKGAAGFFVTTILFIFSYTFIMFLRYLTRIVYNKHNKTKK